MIPFSIILEGDNAWPDLHNKEDVSAGLISSCAVLDRGMSSGKPSVCFRIEMDDQSVVLAQTSARVFCTAAKAIMAKYPDLFEGDG